MTPLEKPCALPEEKEEENDDPINSSYDPTARSCAWCYAVLITGNNALSLGPDTLPTDVEPAGLVVPTNTTCPHCPRIYCSQSCCDVDWDTHNFWCGKAGEKGIDFDVCEIAGKGLGIVTKRAFARGEKILAERPVLTTNGLTCAHTVLVQEEEAVTSTVSNVQEETRNESSSSAPKSSPSCTENTPAVITATENEENEEKVNTNIRTAAMALTPIGGSLGDKVHANGVSVGPGNDRHGPATTTTGSDCTTTASNEYDTAAGLFLTFSRVNHDCVGNSDHYFDHQHGVEVLVANDTIAMGTEITFPYTRNGKDRLTDLNWRGFTCACRACQSDEWGSKLNRLTELEQQVSELGGNVNDTQRHVAVQSAKAMLTLFDEIHVSDRDYARIHYDLFQILVVQQASLKQANMHIAKAYEHALSFCGYEDHETVERFLHYRNHPETHGNYRAID